MNTDNSITQVVKREEFTYPATEKGTLIVSIELQRRIEWLHKHVGKTEWCGVLFYKRLEGDIDNPKTLKLLASDLYLMDIGKETYTEADFDANTAVEMWEAVNDDYSYKRGLIHTHHAMTTFFSSTDMQELHDNTGTHNYYLSLIVNFSGIWTAKVAHIAKRKSIMEYTNVQDETKEFVTEKELLMMIDMNIIKEQEEVAVSDFFRTRYDSLKTQIEERIATQVAKYTPLPTTNYAINKSNMLNDANNRSGYGNITTTSPAKSVGGARIAESKISITINSEGNLQKADKIYRPIGKVAGDIQLAILQWLHNGLNICSDMNTAQIFDNPEAVVQYYKDYFDEPAHDIMQYNYFVDQLQRTMEDSFKKWFPQLVQRIGMEHCDILSLNNPVGAAIYDMFDCYPQFMIELGYTTTKNEISKKRLTVNARRGNRH